MEEKKKLNFFQRFYMAIFKLEEYPKFFEEKWTKALGYFTLFIFLVSLIIGVVGTAEFVSMFEKGYSFFKTLPEFEYKDNTFSDNVYSYGYDEEYGVFFLMDTYKDFDTFSEVEEKIKDEYGASYLDSNISIMVYKGVAYCNYYGEILEINYNDTFNVQGITSFSKNEVVNLLDNGGKTQAYLIYYAYVTVLNFVSMFFSYIIEIIMLAIFVDILGLTICKVKIKFREGFAIGSYAITLPVVITLIYTIVNYFTGFYMEYISYMTVIIEYVYVVAVMFMIKSDRQKLQEELAEVEVVHSEVVKELEEKKENKKDKEDDKEENPVDGNLDNTDEESLENQVENINDLNEEDKQIGEDN